MKSAVAIRTLLLAGSFLAPISISAAASAQEAAAPAQEAGEAPGDVIIVTATRRAESVQDVPINISAVTSDMLQSQRTLDLREVARTVPGVYIVDQGARSGTPIVFRGLNADPLGSFDGDNSGGGSVATYVGEIPLYVDLRLNDMERVEFLLGPQGTLYGAGTLGGAIRYIPKRPQFDAVGGEVRADLYSYKEGKGLSTDTGVTINFPLTPTLAFRGSIDLLNDRGFIDYPFLVNSIGKANPNDIPGSTHRGRDLNTNETVSARAALRFRPSDAADINLTYYFQSQQTDGRQFSSYRNTILPVTAGKWESALRVREPNKRDTQLVSLEAVLDLGFAQLTSASGYSKFKDDGNRDQTDLLISLEYSYEAFPDFTAYTLERGKSENWTQELRLVSQAPGPFKWIVGGFYNKSKSSGFSKEFTPYYDEFLGGSRPDFLEYYSVSKARLREVAAYGELSYELFDGFQITAGGRYYDYKLRTQQATDLPLLETVFNGRDPDSTVLEFEPGGQDDNGFLYKLNASYKFTPDALVYATYSKGYRIGGSNNLTACEGDGSQQNVCGQPGELFFTPDKTTNYEIGFKTQWFDRKLTLNGAIYYIDWKGPQVSSATEIGSQPITINGAGAETKGFELAMSWAITNGLTLRGNYAYTDPELTGFSPSLIQYSMAPGFGTLYADGEKGDRLPGSPKHSGSVFLEYEKPIGNDMTIGFSYNMSVQSNVLSRTGARGGSLTLPGFSMHGAALKFSKGGFSTQLYVDNLFNKFAEVGVRGTPQGLQVLTNADGGPVYYRSYGTFVLPPRQIGLRSTLKF